MGKEFEKRAITPKEGQDRIYRRFIPIGTAEEMDKFHSLAEEKNLSREDLCVILRAIKLNPDISW